MDLISLRNIETAAKNIKRLSVTFHLAFLVRFICSLSSDEVEEIVEVMDQKNIDALLQKWMPLLLEFMEKGKRENATFALHAEMMAHFDEVVGICIAERIGGSDGYSLLLACVKLSLPFAFLNGSSSYASFCTELLHIHYSAGPFHQHLKQSLYTTPHKDSNVNFALDTQREMDHLDAIKGFRPRASLQTVIPRMAVVDHFADVQKTRKLLNQSGLNVTKTSVLGAECAEVASEENVTQASDKELNFDISDKDLKFAIPVTRLILRAGALSMEKDETPRNLYHPDKISLTSSILDRETYRMGEYLTMKYACQQGLFQLTTDDIPPISSVEGPKDLMQRLKSSKGVTLRRSTLKSKVLTDEEKKETKRIAHVKKQTKVVECLSSDMNTCQALVKPDCSKPGLQKSPGIKKALLKLLSLCFTAEDSTPTTENIALREGLMLLDFKQIPKTLQDSIKYATVEFAGVKFKTKATSGDDYLVHIEKGTIGRILKDFPALERIIVCEEKYSFTPDDFQAATRLKRQKTSSTSITHLQEASDILTDEKLMKSAVIYTELGKRLISNYLARNVCKLDFKHNLVLDIDSELITKTVPCPVCDEPCTCPEITYTVHVRAVFKRETGFLHQSVLQDIKQRKGEAEMAQVDWLLEIAKNMKEKEAVVSIVTSADIDSLVIHLFCLAFHWPRNDDGTFKNTVYVLLQKQKSEIYNITGILERLEMQYGRDCLPNIAIALCIGGNDFLPKFHGHSHEKWLLKIIQTPCALSTIVNYTYDKDTGKPIGCCK